MILEKSQVIMIWFIKEQCLKDEMTHTNKKKNPKQRSYWSR